MLGKKFTFVIDDNNMELIHQLWLYITNNPSFIGDHQKGIFLSGNIGTGKTVLMLAFLEVMKSQSGLNYTALFPEMIHLEYKNKGLFWYQKRPLFIDDICREPQDVKDYGKKVEPVREITMYRNRFSNENYATANFRVYANGKLLMKNQLIERYGVMVFDRMKEMFNFMELTGKSRR